MMMIIFNFILRWLFRVCKIFRTEPRNKYEMRLHWNCRRYQSSIDFPKWNTKFGNSNEELHFALHILRCAVLVIRMPLNPIFRTPHFGCGINFGLLFSKLNWNERDKERNWNKRFMQCIFGFTIWQNEYATKVFLSAHKPNGCNENEWVRVFCNILKLCWNEPKTISYTWCRHWCGRLTIENGELAKWNAICKNLMFEIYDFCCRFSCKIFCVTPRCIAPQSWMYDLCISIHNGTKSEKKYNTFVNAYSKRRF